MTAAALSIVVSFPGAGCGATELATVVPSAQALVVLTGELDMATAPHLRAVLEPLGRAAPTLVTVDVASLSFIDASGLGEFVRGNNALERGGGGLRLRSPSAMCVRLLRMTQLDVLLTVPHIGNPTESAGHHTMDASSS